MTKTACFNKNNQLPIIRILNSRALNNRINDNQERALRLAYKYNESSFNELLEKKTFYDGSLQKLTNFSQSNLES